MAEIAKKTKRYPTDLTDEEWERMRPFLPKPGKRGRKPATDLRDVLNAIRYMARSGGGWRMLPKDFPPWQTVYWWFRRFVRRFLFKSIHDMAVMIDRERMGREASPSAGILDSQSVKAPGAAARGYDAGKKIVGRKRHIAVDTDGRLLMVNLTTADISDSAGAQMILDAIRKRWPWIKHLFADGAYDRRTLMDKAAAKEFVVGVRRRRDPEHRRAERLRGPAQAMGCRAHLRLDDPLAPPRARLREPHRRLHRHDPRRHGKLTVATHPPFRRRGPTASRAHQGPNTGLCRKDDTMKNQPKSPTHRAYVVTPPTAATLWRKTRLPRFSPRLPLS